MAPKTAQEWREAIWPTGLDDSRCGYCNSPIDYCQGHGAIGDPEGFAALEGEEDDEHEADGLDPVSPPCELCPEFADIVCQITEFHKGIYLCNRCHRSHIDIVACYNNYAAS